MRTLSIGHMAIGLAAVVGVVPAASAQDPRVAVAGKPAGTATEAQGPQADQGLASNSGLSIAVPIGRVSVGPEFVEGEDVYERRTKSKEGMTIVEVSTTPFMPVLASNQQPSGVVRSDQPTPW